jgi:CHAD domain-containing protein
MEIEAKFTAPDGELLDRLGDAAHLAGYPIFAGRTEQLEDVYLDSGEWVMLKAGFACRRRRIDGSTLITVKQVRSVEDGIHRREELEVNLPADLPANSPPSDWPDSEAKTKVLQLVGDQPLTEKLSLSQSRSTRWVGTIDRPLVEMGLDEVRLQPSGVVYHEVELELVEAGTEEDLAALVDVLRNDWKLEPQPLSKFERALAATGQGPSLNPPPVAETEVRDHADEAPLEAEREEKYAERDETTGGEESAPAEDDTSPSEVAEQTAAPQEREPRGRPFLGDGLETLSKPGIAADDSMSTAANKLLLYHLQRMMKHEPGTRDGEDPEELHDMRVATRRMRAALRVFADYLDAGEYKPYLRMVRTTGRELGAVRDLDVFRIKTQAYIDSLPAGDRSGLDPLMEAWGIERERARAELIEYLDSDRYQHFKEKFERFLRTPGAGAGRAFGPAGEPIPTRVGDVLPAILFQRLAGVRAFDSIITRPDAPLSRYHELRIAGKGLRYTLEFFQEVLGPGSKPLINTTKVVQDHLGDLQDAVVTCDVLLGFLGSGTWGPPRPTTKKARSPFPVNAPGVAAYLAVKQLEIETLMATFGPVWEEIRSTKFSQPLASLLGPL